MSWGGGIKRTKHDAVFSDCIREAANWTCHGCGKTYHNNTRGLSCSHIFSRRTKSTRWFPDNALAHCVGCHRYYQENPIEFAVHAKQILGEPRYIELKTRFHQPRKYKPWELEELYQHYKQQLKLMRECRDMGHEGQFEVTSYD